MLPGLRNGIPWPTQNQKKRSLDPLPEGFRKQTPAFESPDHENVYSYTLRRGPGYPAGLQKGSTNPDSNARRAAKRRPRKCSKNNAKKAAVRCRTCPTGGFQKGRCRFRGEINGWPKTGSRCSCAPFPQKAPSRVVFGDVFGMFRGLAWANRGGQTVLRRSATSPWLHLLLAGADAPRPFKKQLL